jgi:uncharacterized membrane protein YfcA
MLFSQILSGIEINLVLVAFLGLLVGMVNGFIGAGGGFLMAPALIIVGFPANFAVGTSLAWITGSALMGTLRHRQLGNIDMKLGIWLVTGTLCGVEGGVRILNEVKKMGFADQAVLAASITILLVVGIYTLREVRTRKALLDSMVRNGEKLPPAMRALAISKRLQNIRVPPMIHFAKSRLTISLWIILSIGLLTGLLAGFIGVSGGFIMVPLLVYLVGLPSFLAVGTNMFQVIFTASFGCARHTISSNVLIFLAFILLLSSPLGVQCGVLVTRFVRGLAMRYVLAVSIFICVGGSIIKLLDIILEVPTAWLRTGSICVIFGGMALIAAMIVGLFVIALRYKAGKPIPIWAESLIQNEDR